MTCASRCHFRVRRSYGGVKDFSIDVKLKALKPSAARRFQHTHTYYIYDDRDDDDDDDDHDHDDHDDDDNDDHE